jgi:hypothetical protein
MQRGDPLRFVVRAFVGSIEVQSLQAGFAGCDDVQVVQVPKVEDVTW